MIAMDNEDEYERNPWWGEFMLESTWGYDGNGLSGAIKREISPVWPLVRAGAFGGDEKRAEAAFEALSQRWTQRPRGW
jgi:hypothetical protein